MTVRCRVGPGGGRGRFVSALLGCGRCGWSSGSTLSEAGACNGRSRFTGMRTSPASPFGVGRRLRGEPGELHHRGGTADGCPAGGRFFATPHLWKPATVRSHRPVVRALIDDDLGRRRLVTLTAGDVQAAIRRWQKARLSVPTRGSCSPPSRHSSWSAWPLTRLPAEVSWAVSASVTLMAAS